MSSIPKLYLSFDIEADGPCPLLNSMVQLGIAGVIADGTEKFAAVWNVKREAGHHPDTDTMNDFWAQHRSEWEATQVDPMPSSTVQATLANVIDGLSQKFRIVWIAYPGAFDWQWIKELYERHKQPDDPDIGYSAKCISTLLWAYEKIHGITDKDALKRELAGDLSLTHNALDDARYQARMFVNLCQKMGIAL
jgi:ribonuclease T